MKIIDHIPRKNDLLAVYGLITMLIYGWSTIQFLWGFTGWIKYLRLNEIGVVYAYMLTTNLAESLLVLGSLIFVSIILPTKWFRDDFIVRGGLSVLYLLIFVMVVSYQAVELDELRKYVIRGLIDFLFLHFIIKDVRSLKKMIISLADRSIVFLYLTIPLSFLGLIVVIIRNI